MQRLEEENFSIHSPLAGRDMWPFKKKPRNQVFQSTRPLRGETAVAGCSPTKYAFQSTRPLRGETVVLLPPCPHGTSFQSTRPLRGETKSSKRIFTVAYFQSTRPLRGETGVSADDPEAVPFSIHSPLAGRDCTRPRNGTWRRCFQSTRPLRGETPRASSNSRQNSAFQSTRPLRGETPIQQRPAKAGTFSIHSPLAGRDPKFFRQVIARRRVFNPLAPCGARQ